MTIKMADMAEQVNLIKLHNLLHQFASVLILLSNI